MSEDVNKKIQQITELLGQEEMPENIKSLLNMLASSISNSAGGGRPENKDDAAGADVGEASGSNTGNNAVYKEQDDGYEEKRPMSFTGSDINDITAKLKKAVNSMGNINDPRINLLNAIKPFLNNRRQSKISNCIQLLQITSLTRMLSNQEK
jgi:hypothetical protein